MKRKFNHFYLSLLGGALLTLGACSKNDDPRPDPIPIPENVGVFVLNEGASQNSDLGFLSYGTEKYTDNAYSGSLGKGGNDMVSYGSKLYITVTDANKLVVLNAFTKQELRVINISLPRNVIAHKGKVYVTSQGENTLAAIDTLNYSINSTSVGHSPEQLTVTNGKIYVANSGWREAANGGDYDNRISVVNPSTLTVEDNIIVAKNITSIAADTTKNILYVNAAAIYGSGSEPTSPSKLYVVNTANKQITPMTFGAEEIEVLSFLKRAVLISRNYNNNSNGNGQLLVMNTDNQTVQLFSSSTSITNAYSLNFIPEVPALFVGDADNYVNKGKMNIFNFDVYSGAFSNGFAVNVGVSPKAFAVSHSSKK